MMMTRLFGRFGYSRSLEYKKKILYLMILLSIAVASFFLLIYCIYVPFKPAIIVHVIYLFFSMSLYYTLKNQHYFYVKISMVIAHLIQLTLAVFLWFPVSTGFNLYYIMVPMVMFLIIDYEDLIERYFAIGISIFSTLLFLLSESLDLPNYMYQTSIIMNRFFSSVAIITILFPMTYIFTRFAKELNSTQRELRVLATTDVLTHLVNRRVLYEDGVEKFHLAESNGQCLTLLLFDIDFFKRINDDYGHPVGDQILIGLSNLVTETIGDEVTFSRYGGEEFAILMDEDYHSAKLIADQLLNVIREKTFNVGGIKIQLTVSIGLAHYDKNIQDFDHMMKIADNALYMAKNCGRNQVISH